MPRDAIALLYWHELRMLLRDMRALLIAVGLPLVFFPVVLLITQQVMHAQERRSAAHTYTYAITGEAADLRAMVTAAAALDDAGADQSRVTFAPYQGADPREALARGELDVLAEVTYSAGDGLPEIRLLAQGNRQTSMVGAGRLADHLATIRGQRREAALRAHGLKVLLSQVGAVSAEDVAPARHAAGLMLGRMLTPLLLFFLFAAGALVAVDALAGEKERGTLEALLATAAPRTAIVMAKLLAILTVTAVVTCIQAANFAVYVGCRLIPLPANVAGAVTPGTAVLLLLLYLPLALLVSAALLLVSGYAKTYKEAQLYFTPLMLVGAAPALVPLLPETSLNSLLVLVPIANIALAVRDLLTGTLTVPLALLAWGVTAGAALWAVRETVHLLGTERLVTATEHDADEPPRGPGLFPRHVVRWFAVLWALALISGSYLSTPERVPLQVAVNLGVLFLGGAFAMIRYYRLDWREALAIRLPHPLAWVAVLVAAPAGLVTGTGLFRLAIHLFPVPASVLEEMARAMNMGPMPVWGQLLLLGILPGICEEIAFRGVLLHGLRRRFTPVVLALVVGAIFGLFHFLLFRFATTALLGALLAATVMLTGSIFPAMLWHILNNTLALTSGDWVESLPPLAYLISTVVLAGALYALWRVRRVYPGLRDASPHRP